ncbi:MAG: sulfatase-like hydrolase/transferase [Acidobacteriaceae bacterium]|nr:sulfatase-like hydrolase/transferase [Acidobacteriaceae bacterium]
MSPKSASAAICLCVCLQCAAATSRQAGSLQQRPNILFVIMDDVGIDQMRSFGYGGVTAPNTPVLDLVAQQGLRFRNVWAMPECSPSRAIFFEGRYPLRTNIFTAILTTDLANSQVSPFESTTPKILKTANYKSALFGKFHLAGPTNNPYGEGTPNSLGFDYFDGFLEGAPHPIDTTGGNVNPTGGTPTFPTGPYTCGFVPSKEDDSVNGSDKGACYFADARGCQMLSASSAAPAPGRACMEQGGIFWPMEMGGTSCQSAPPSQLNFNLANGYYVFNLVTNDLQAGTVYKHPLTDPRARIYSPIETTDAAVQWINSQPGDQPWMATVAYASIHSPYQQAPQSLTPSEPDLSGVICGGSTVTTGDYRTLSNQMVEAMDTEIGRLLVELGIASLKADGSLQYDPSASNTMVVVIGDNGTYAPSVKAPFDPTHAKGFVNQTGVWVPLIVAGPLVNTPNRDVESMINIADLFQFWGEVAGVDVRSQVPPSRIIDSVSMLPYLMNPSQGSLRSYNFTQTGINISADGQRPGPCLITIPQNGPPLINTCVQLFPQPALCMTEGGTWYGNQYQNCCQVQQALSQMNIDVQILPLTQAAVRNDNYKLSQVTNENCSGSPDTVTLHLFRIDQTPVTPLIDYDALDLITNQSNPTSGLTPEQAANFNDLLNRLNNILSSSPDCPADGNSDGIVNQVDLDNWNLFHKSGSSWYDFNFDGKTDTTDQNTIFSNLGRTCAPK